MAASRVTFVTGTAEVRRRENPGGMESAAQPVTFVDGKCSCCPYGYHIDLDFLNFCKNVAEGSTLSNLKRIQRTKRKLRKSMEVMLQQQHHHGDSATATLAPTPPPDVVHSTEASRLINMVQYEQSATHQVLRDIDSSVNATLASIDTMQRSKASSRSQRYMSSDSEDGYSPLSPPSATLPQYQARFDTYPPSPSAQAPLPPPRRSSLLHHHLPHQSNNGDESSHLATSLSTSGRTDSLSSLSSVSTVSSEQVLGGQYTSHASGMLNHPHEMATAQMRKTEFRNIQTTGMTSEKLAATMATHFPQTEHDGRESPSSPMSPMTTISKASLAAIREAMAVSLQRMRDLEEQVKAIPILQVRISVLKEEKRLLDLQLKAKSGSPSVRSIGVGKDNADSPDGIISPSTVACTFSYPTAASPFVPLASSPRSPSVKTPPATLPKPGRVRTCGVGDHSVLEPYLLQPGLPIGFTISDHQVLTEIRSVHERETLVDRGTTEQRLGSTSLSDHSMRLTSSDEMVEPRMQTPVQTHFTINQIQRTVPRPMTRSIGIGEGNVHDTSLQIHEKELRTVIIGGTNGAVGKRNVGVEVRVPTRSVGVSYSCDDARPATRSIGVNVTYDTSGILTSLDFRGESELRTALRGVLQRNVHSVGTNCNFKPITMDVGIQHEVYNMVSVGSGGDDCHIDVDIRPVVAQRTLGVNVRPETSNRMVSTDKDWVLEQGVNTVAIDTYNKACNTEGKKLVPASTNTERIHMLTHPTQTEQRVFQGMDQVKNVGSNTTQVSTSNTGIMTIPSRTYNVGVNTTSPNLGVENFDFQITFDDKASNTPKHFRDFSVNTSERELQLSISKVECLEVAASESAGDYAAVEQVQVASARPLTLQEQILQRGSKQASAFISSTSSAGSVSPTSPRQRSSLTDDTSSGSTFVETTTYTTSYGPRYMTDPRSDQLDGSSASRSHMQTEVFSSSPGAGFGAGLQISTGDSNNTTKGSRINTRNVTGSSGAEGSSYLERFGFTKSSQSSGGVGMKTSSDLSTGYSDLTKTSWDLSAVEGGSAVDGEHGEGSVSRSSFTRSSGSSVQQGGLSDSGVDVHQGVVNLVVLEAESSADSSQALLTDGAKVSSQDDSQLIKGSAPTSSEMFTETTVVKRSSPGSRLTKHRHSDGKITRDFSSEMKGAYSGRRVGSVEDFMPDDMRRLMNIELSGASAGSGTRRLQQWEEGAGDKSGLTVTKTVRTVTTKRSSQDGKTTTSVTKTITNPDGSVTTTTTGGADDSDMEMKEGRGLGMLSSARFDLSRIADDDSVTEASTEFRSSTAQSEGGIKDSGYYDSSSFAISAGSCEESEETVNGGTAVSEHKELKSIMKRSKSDTSDKGDQKKGISFADSVIGGTGSSSESEASESDTESTTSFEEGSYDSREGDISYTCCDDEAIAQGLPGAKMYDQNIRETYELTEEMQQACDVLATYLVDSTTIQTKELNASMTVVKDEWFRVSSHKLSSAHQVEDYLSSINEISQRLLEYVVNMVDSNGNAAIHYCVSHCNFDTVSLLLDTEVCDIKRPNKAGYTPIMLAALAYVQSDDHRDIIRSLFQTGDINTQADVTGQTALMLAVSHGRTDMVQLLLEEGADCNIQDLDGSTALMCACEHGHSDIVQMLLAQPDCDASLTDNENSNALSIAMEAGHKDIGVLIYKHLNFSKPAASPAGFQKKRKGSSSPTPRHVIH